MKIRSSKSFFNSDLGEEDLKCQLLPDIENPTYPIVISNNKCSVALGSETLDNDSSLSFLLKFKAGFTKPKGITIGVAGFELPNKGFKNSQINDGNSPFRSVNINHFDLTLSSEQELDLLVDEIIKIKPHHHSFDLGGIKNYIFDNLENPEWVEIYKSSKEWSGFKNGFLREQFIGSHCEINHADLFQYKKANKDNEKLLQDLNFLKRHNAITDTKQLKAVKTLFPEIFE